MPEKNCIISLTKLNKSILSGNMSKQKIWAIGISMTVQDKAKLDRLAQAKGENRSEMVRTLIRSRRLPKTKPGKKLLG